MPDEINEAVCSRFARTFSPGLMMLLDRSTSGGIDIRPRPGRLEVCGEYVSGTWLRAVAAFFVGGVKAAAGCGELLPPDLKVNLGRATDRYGLRVMRHAFGGDLYRDGRRAVLTRLDGRSISAQQQLELSWSAARGHVSGLLNGPDLALVDQIVAGDLPLGIEAELPEAPRSSDYAPGAVSPLGQITAPFERGGTRLEAVIATWAFTLFKVAGHGRTAYACVPRQCLPRFQHSLAGSGLDDVLRAFLSERPAGRILESPAQTRVPGLWDQVAPAAQLLPAERDPHGSH
jgi:hypothetical protein